MYYVIIIIITMILSLPKFRGNHFANTTCLAQVLFNSGEYCSKFNWPY